MLILRIVSSEQLALPHQEVNLRSVQLLLYQLQVVDISGTRRK